MRKFLASGEETSPDSRTIGDFRADGSWNDSAQFRHRGPRYQFIASLVRVRRAARLSPAQIASQIEASPFAEMFGELKQWHTLASWEQWPFAWTRTSADETVKRNGAGAVAEFHWQLGTFHAGMDERPFVPAQGVADFVANISERLALPSAAVPQGPDSQPSPLERVPDEVFFERAKAAQVVGG
jgi:hypothetical protein